MVVYLCLDVFGGGARSEISKINTDIYYFRVPAF
jgi:hypothetical protein